MARSLGDMILKIKADASQYVSELMRADNETRRSVQKMDRELDKFSRGLSKKFSLSDVSKDIVRGLGIGSGFALAQQGADLLASYWQKAAEEAKSVEESTAKQLQSVLAIIAARQTEQQKLTVLRKAEADAMKAYFAELEKSKKGMSLVGSNPVLDFAGGLYDRYQGVGRGANVASAVAAYQKAYEERMAGEKSAADETVKIAEEGYKLIEEIDKANADALRKTAQDLAKDREKIAREELDYQMDLHRSEVEATETRDKRITEDTQARMKVMNDMIFGEAEAALENMKSPMREFESQMAQMWNGVSDRAGQAFADMVMTGKASFAALGDMIARSVIEIVARMAIINPLLNMLFGGFGGWASLPAFFGSGAAPKGGGRAIGGPVNAGVAYTVGERGREMFIPDTAGTIIPAEQTANMLGGGGNTYVIDARGADQGAVARIERTLLLLAGPGVVERRAVGAVMDRGFRMAT